jgi:hypothetical protein
MPAPGPMPKPADQRVRRNKESGDWREVPNVPFDGPALPHDVDTVFAARWWDKVRQMPHCALWSQSDWLFAEATAVIADAFSKSPKEFAAELRMREKVLGLTDDDRVRLRIRYVDATPSTEGANVARMSDYRDL